MYIYVYREGGVYVYVFLNIYSPAFYTQINKTHRHRTSATSEVYVQGVGNVPKSWDTSLETPCTTRSPRCHYCQVTTAIAAFDMST